MELEKIYEDLGVSRGVYEYGETVLAELRERFAEIDRVALSCGGGGEFFRRAHELGANVYITGEMKHHERIEAQGLGMQVILAGHEESERVVLEPLKNRLEALLPGKTPIFIA